MSWEDRYFCRDFDSSKIPSIDIINNICDVINYIPSQITNDDHFWFLLEYDNPQHVKLKEWLVENLYYHMDSTTYENISSDGEHFGMALDAPYVLFCALRKFAYNQKTVELEEKEWSFMIKNSHLSAGAILAEVVHSGLDNCVIGCTHGMRLDPNKDHNAKRNEFRKLIWEIFPEVNGWLLEPALSICMGYGTKHSKEDQDVISRHGYNWINYKDQHKNPNLIKTKKNI